MMFYLCDKAENIIRMLPTYKCDFAVQELVLNGLYTLNFNIDIKDKWIMDDVEFIIHKDSEDKSNFFMYKLINSENNKNKIEYKAIYIAMDELESYAYITDKKPKNIKASQAVNIAIDETKWELGNIDDSKLKSLNFYYSSPLKALTKVIDVYNIELNFRLKANKNKIVKRLIDVKSKIGSFTGKRFFYGSNALEVIQETNTSGIYTKFIPRGRGEEVGDGYGRRIDIKDVVWSKADGDPMDKPKGQEFIEFEDMTALYGHSDGTARHTVVNFDNIDDPKELIKEAYSYGKVNSRPQVAYKSDVTKVGRIGLGDGVLIIRKDLDIRYTARVYKIVRDLKNLDKTQVELGDSRDISQARKNMNFQKRLDNLDEFIGETNLNFVKQIQKGLTESMYNQESYRYESTPGDDSGLLSGTWYFNKPIDQNPDRALYLGGGHIAMANKKDSDGNWEFTTIANGDGVVADVIVAGILKGGKVRWNLEDGTFIIGTSSSDYSLYWDGSTLHLQNVDIDLKNNRTIQDLKEKQGLSEREIADHKKELQEANAELDKARNDLNLAKNEITNLSNDFTLSNIVQDKTNKTVEEKLLNLSTSLNITDEKIESKAESIRKELETYTNDKDKDIRAFLSRYYSSKTQTDKKIEDKVGALRTSFDDKVSGLENTISKTQSSISQINDNINISVNEFKKSITGSLSDMSSKINSFSNKHVNFIKSSDNWDIDNVSGSHAYIGKDTGSLMLDPKENGLSKYIYYFQLENVEDVDEYTLYLDLGAMTEMINVFAFTLTNKMGRPITDDIYVGASYVKSNGDITRKLVRHQGNTNTPYFLRMTVNMSSSNNGTDQWAQINNKSIALVSGWHEDLTWEDTYLLKNLEIDDLKAEIDVNSRGIALRVRENEVISAINQSAEQIKIQANRINLEGDVNLTGTFSNINSQGQGVSIRNNRLQVYDNSINDRKKTIGQIWPSRFSDRQGGRMRLDHFATGLTEINYIKKYTYDDYYHYMVFDINGYTDKSVNKSPITVFENMYFANHKKLRFGNWEFVSERDGVLKIKPVDVKAGFLFSHRDWQHKDGFHYYYASGGKDVTSLIKGM